MTKILNPIQAWRMETELRYKLMGRKMSEVDWGMESEAKKQEELMKQVGIPVLPNGDALRIKYGVETPGLKEFLGARARNLPIEHPIELTYNEMPTFWVRGLEEYLREYLPKRCAELEAAGTMDTELDQAADLIGERVDALRSRGLSMLSAERIAFPVMFPVPETRVWEALGNEGEALVKYLAEYQPERFKTLVETETLYTECRKIGDMYLNQTYESIVNGMLWNEAREILVRQYLCPTPEPGMEYGYRTEEVLAETMY